MVSFSSTQAVPPVDIAAVVLPQLRSRSHADASARATVLRAVAAGVAANVRPHDLRRLIRSYGSPDQVALVSDDARWWRTVKEQRAHVARQSSAEGEYENRLAYARLAIARVTTPIPAGIVSDRRLAQCRRALAIIAARGIKTSFRKTLVTSGFLATVMGVSVPTAVRILRSLEKDLAWIRRAGSRGAGLKFELTSLRGDTELRERAWLHADSIDAWASGQVWATPLATLLSVAAHPAWGYAEDSDGKRVLSSREWLALIHERAGVAPDQSLGLTPTARRRTLRNIEKVLPHVAGDDTLSARLDAFAVACGATARRDRAAERHAAEAAANRERLEAVRAAKAERIVEARRERDEARPVVTALLKRIGEVPSAKDRSAGTGWVNAAKPHLDHVKPGVRPLLVKRMAQAGWSDTMIEKAAGFLFLGEVHA